METQTRTYNLFIRNSWAEDSFIIKYGQDLFDKLRAEAFRIDMGRCAGCGHEPPEYRKKECLFYHIDEQNNINPELTKGVTLCKACHTTQHIKNAIKNKWIIFINSAYNQNALIRLIRANQTHGAVQQRKIVDLKTPPEQIFNGLFIDGKFVSSPTLKIIFTSAFVIDDLY